MLSETVFEGLGFCGRIKSRWYYVRNVVDNYYIIRLYSLNKINKKFDVNERYVSENYSID